MKLHPILLSLALSLCFSPVVQALDQIVRPFQSVRIAGMGGVRMTTGLYEENFFNNPARVTANPSNKLTILDLIPVETTPNTIQSLSSLSNGGDALLKEIAKPDEPNLHYRAQVILPAYFLATTEQRDWGLGFGLIGHAQVDSAIRQSYQADLGSFLDFGPALTFGHEFLEDHSLSVGITAHFLHRVATKPDYTLLEYVRGVSPGINTIGAEGWNLDFDLGSTYELTEYLNFDIAVGLAIQNILGGKYSMSSPKVGSLPANPPEQPRSIGAGVSASRKEWGPFDETVFAFEITDIGNNANGSLFRLLHLGGEARWKALAVRLGLNQGYLAAGFGMDLGFFKLDLATYGEEMGLNSGSLQDRRYALGLGFHI